ncbi:MYG1 family protein [Alicyclobacillus fructus]|uniref:MYG1 family protein n=1 Tax=Alicyclobacillus fructus TaxID=2816082 RepID=UPI001A8E7705|nr:MYG1 family protein [Alicyclobacillus fructus]
MKIGTHHGKFHADEVFAVAIVKQIYPDAQIVRTRNKTLLAQCDLVVDVGGGPYDHHTVQKVHRQNGIPYASAGLIWRDYGDRFLEKLGVEREEDRAQVCNNMDDKLFQAIDAIDNGIDLERDMRIKGISELVGSFNPPWNSPEDENQAFERALNFATQILMNYAQHEISRIQAIEIVKTAYANRKEPELLVLPTCCPWTETLLEIDVAGEVLYVAFPDKTGQYRLQVVPKGPGTFEARKPLPMEWAGKEGDELISVCGVEDAVFCHPARFIAGAETLDGILRMAEEALSAEPSNL